jgi:hypothetical protein
MHKSFYRHMADLVTRYLTPLQSRELRILDIRSCDINGSYRPLFEKSNWHYLGVDVNSGPNVDLVLSNQYRWRASLVGNPSSCVKNRLPRCWPRERPAAARAFIETIFLRH